MIETQTSYAPFEKLKSLVESELEVMDELILSLAKKSDASLIPELIEYLMSSGGKRLRPILTLTCGKLIGCEPIKAIKLASSVEFIHTATLFHDDVIDETPLRRGKKTANNIWGNKASILVGDFLFSQAFKLMVETDCLKALATLASTSIAITESEVWQLELLNKFDITEAEYIKLITGKTAVLFGAACSTPGMVTALSDFEISALNLFGLNLGIAFQIIDDLLDYTSSNKKFGKVVGSDLFEKKITLPVIILKQFLTNQELARVQNILENDIEQDDVSYVIELLNKYDCISLCKQKAYNYSKIAIENISMFSNKEIVNLLIELTEHLVQRYY